MMLYKWAHTDPLPLCVECAWCATVQGVWGKWQDSGATAAFLHRISILGRRISDRKASNYADVNIWQTLSQKLIPPGCFKRNEGQKDSVFSRCWGWCFRWKLETGKAPVHECECFPRCKDVLTKFIVVSTHTMLWNYNKVCSHLLQGMFSKGRTDKRHIH